VELNVDRKTPLQVFSRKLVRVKYIQHIQNDLKTLDANKLDQKILYLNQTYILHLVAYWQDFVETLAQRGFEELIEDTEENVLNSVLKINLDNRLKRFNTPNRENIDLLFNEILGIKKITNIWNWGGMNRNVATKKLKDILNCRHQISHTGMTTSKLNYDFNFKAMEFIFNLAAALEFGVFKFVNISKGKNWEHVFVPPK
jgi:hypothetical protein